MGGDVNEGAVGRSGWRVPAFDISTAMSARAMRRIGAPMMRGVCIHG